MSPDRMLAEEIGRRLRAIRQSRGLTQRALTRRVGPMDLSYVGKIERGEQLPSLKTLRRLAAALGVPLSRFFETKAQTPPGAERGADQTARLRKMLLRLPPGDLPLLEEVVRVLIRHRQERVRHGRGGGRETRAAEPRSRYRRSRLPKARPPASP